MALMRICQILYSFLLRTMIIVIQIKMFDLKKVWKFKTINREKHNILQDAVLLYVDSTTKSL